MELLLTFVRTLGWGAFWMLWIFPVLWGLERLAPRGKQAGTEDVLRAIRYWAVYLLSGTVFVVIAGAMLRGREPLLMLSIPERLPTWALYVAGPLLAMAVYDFFNYWMHRAQHKWFWAQHSVHHSIENLSGINSYFHWTEDLFRLAFIVAPMTLLLGVEGGAFSIAGAMLTKMHGNYLHSPTRFNFGPLGRMIADNRWHRVHHSLEVQHFDRNFGTAITLWDHLFGTAYVPAKDEWPDTGVHDLPETRTMREYLLRPFAPVRAWSIPDIRYRPKLPH